MLVEVTINGHWTGWQFYEQNCAKRGTAIIHEQSYLQIRYRIKVKKI
jgi:hypothetical protein